MLKQLDLTIKLRFISVPVFLLIIFLSSIGLFEGSNNYITDLFITIKITQSPLEQSPRIWPVDLNNSAERNLSGLVEMRQAFVDLFTVMNEGDISGAMDFLFMGEKNPSIDMEMAKIAAELENLVLAIVPIPKDLANFSGKELEPIEKEVLRSHLWYPKVIKLGEIPEVSTFLLPNVELLKSATNLGHIGIQSEKDGIYRKNNLLYRWEDGYIPTLSLAIAVAYLDINTDNIVLNPGKELILPLKDGEFIKLPIDNTGAMWIPYPAKWNEGWERTDLDKVVNALNNEDLMYEMVDRWDDNIVIAADLTTAHKDFGVTPFESVYPLSGIHSSLLNGVLTNTFYTPPSSIFMISTCLVLLFLIFIISGKIKRRHLYFTLLLLLLVLLNTLLWFKFLILPWLITPGIGIIATWIFIFAIQLFNSHKNKILLENAMSRYFPSALASRVLKEKNINLSPESKKLTIIFTDIAGFTKWSSEKSPELVHGFLSEYLELMASIIFRFGGTIDKFMGDGILAFFGDPFLQEDHASRCLNSALEMLKEVNNNKGEWRSKYGIDLKIRIGVNSGNVIVGNLGTKTRIEYTVIGAPVNLAQRMESNAPLESILVSEATWAYTKDEFNFHDQKSIKAKGYDKEIIAYILK
ncbi:MAG: hypothetical protein B6229_04655 [Spirochaetaceae bacterium 4572_7]|nr:MAG: hypothetical protein B6229_04655 [Spirochaetaceae bacterium 4572_7]